MGLLVAVRADVEAVRLGQCRDLHELGDAAHVTGVGCRMAIAWVAIRSRKPCLVYSFSPVASGIEVAAAIFLMPS